MNLPPTPRSSFRHPDMQLPVQHMARKDPTNRIANETARRRPQGNRHGVRLGPDGATDWLHARRRRREKPRRRARGATAQVVPFELGSILCTVYDKGARAGVIDIMIIWINWGAMAGFLRWWVSLKKIPIYKHQDFALEDSTVQQRAVARLAQCAPQANRYCACAFELTPPTTFRTRVHACRMLEGAVFCIMSA